MRHYEIVIPLTGTALEKKETTQHLRVCTMLQFKCKVVIRSVFFRFHEKFLMQFEMKKKPSLMHIYQAGGRIWIHVCMDVQKLSSNHNCLHFREVRYV